MVYNKNYYLMKKRIFKKESLEQQLPPEVINTLKTKFYPSSDKKEINTEFKEQQIPPEAIDILKKKYNSDEKDDESLPLDGNKTKVSENHLRFLLRKELNKMKPRFSLNEQGGLPPRPTGGGGAPTGGGGAPTGGGGAPTGGGGAPTGGGGAPTGGIGPKIEEWVNGAWNVVTTVFTVGIKEIAGVANNAIDETAKLLKAAGWKVYKVGGKLYSDFTGSIASLGSGGSSGTATALPDWVNNHPCLKLQNIVGSGKNAIVASKQTQRTYTLSEDGTYFDNDSNKGKWSCKDNTTVTFESSTEKITSNLVGANASLQGGGGGCTIDTFPRCVQTLTLDQTNCTVGGIALKGDIQYKVLYTNKKYSDVAKNITSTEIEYACYIYDQGSTTGQIGRYSCLGENINIVSDAYGNLQGTNISLRKAYTTADYGTMAKAYGGEMVGKFLIADASKNQILNVEETNLNQALYTIRRYISEGWRGRSINNFILFLKNLQRLLASDGVPEASEGIKTQIQEFFDYVETTGTENKTIDKLYQMNVDPDQNDIRFFKTETINQEPFNGFKLYRHPDFEGSQLLNSRMAQYNTKASKTGSSPEDCERYLDFWITNVAGMPDMASRKYRRTQTDKIVDNTLSDTEVNSYRDKIKACAKANRYKGNLLNSEHQKIINYIAQAPEDEGGIRFGRTTPPGQ
jgi:hypothetical protein